MHLNKKIIAQVKAQKPGAAKKQSSKVVATKKQNKSKPQAPVLGKVTKREICVALLSGERGFAARQVEKFTYSNGAVAIKAVQNNLGLPLKNATEAVLEGDKLTSKAPKQARVELGGYVNGRNTGARVAFLTPAQFATRAGKCIVHWKNDDNGIHGMYIGNPSIKGMSAVAVNYGKTTFYWQMEQDANSNNKHERGALKPIGKAALVTVK